MAHRKALSFWVFILGETSSTASFEFKQRARGAVGPPGALRPSAGPPTPPIPHPYSTPGVPMAPPHPMLVVPFMGTARAFSPKKQGSATSMTGSIQELFMNGALNTTKQPPCDPQPTRSQCSCSAKFPTGSRSWASLRNRAEQSGGPVGRTQGWRIPGSRPGQWPKASRGAC